ncbi:MAG: glutathione S-transferase family protein [Pseudomonadota bacterium]
MTAPVTLHGYRFSVYHRIARLALEEKGVPYGTEEVDPFAPDLPGSWRRMHPLGRVPVFVHGDFTIYETAAIARYVDATFAGPSLVPDGARAAARMAQVVGIADAYAYRPLVRQVYAHRVFRPAMGEPAASAEIDAGLRAAPTVLGALEAIAVGGLVLDGRGVTLADCHLAPMIACFVAAPEGSQLLSDFAALSAWWSVMSERDAFEATSPGPMRR